MKIADKWDDGGDKYWDVEIEKDRYITVKEPFDGNGYRYPMDNEDGTKVFDYDGNTYESEIDPWDAVIFVDEEENK